MIEGPLTLRLELESHPENVALVRSALTGIAEALKLGPEMTSDLKTALSEACNNVSLHAYDGGSGPMIVEIDGTSEGIFAAVSDRGSGITRIAGGEDRMGLGLAVISALASSSEFRHPDGGGTEVRMWFRNGGLPAALMNGAGEVATQRLASLAAKRRDDDEVLVCLEPVEVVHYVLGRMVQSIAAASHFSITKISALRRANDAIARYIAVAADGNVDVSIAISGSPRRLAMRAGPLPDYDPESAYEALASYVDGLNPDEENLRIELVDRTRETA